MRYLVLLALLSPGAALAQPAGPYGPGPCPMGASSCVTTATGGTTARSLAARAADVVNVLDYGVKGDGTTDDAAAIRAVMLSNRTIMFPAGRTYYLCSSIASGYPASDLVLMLASQVTNVHVMARGALFTVCDASALSQITMFERSTNWSWDGGTFTGNRTGLISSSENVGFGLMNNTNFRVTNIRMTGFGGTGAAFAGDYNFDGTVRDIIMDGVGIGFDMAFSKNITIDNIKATGANTDGNQGTGQVGQKFFSNIFDIPLAPTVTLTADAIMGATTLVYSVFPTTTTLAVGTAYPVNGTGIATGTTLTPTASGVGTGTGTLSIATTAPILTGASVTAQFNFTSTTITDTDGVILNNSDWSNFATGTALASGSHYKFQNNNSHDNPGISSASGLGYYVYYNASGIASSVGHPVTDVTIIGGQIANNGAAVSGYGVLVDSSAIANSDIIDGITVVGVTFDNNTAIGLGAVGTSVADFVTVGNTYKGSLQTTSINSVALDRSKTIQQSSAGGLKITAVQSAGVDLGFEWARTGSYDWQFNSSTSNGNLYFNNVSTGKIPFTIQAAAMVNGLQVTSIGFSTAGAALLATATVATLPACSASYKGGFMYVTDATAPTYNAALTGGGAVIVPVFCNGSAWTSH